MIVIRNIDHGFEMIGFAVYPSRFSSRLALPERANVWGDCLGGKDCASL